jgi:hypothetical protein
VVVRVLGEKRADRGKHRTEVTEGTEGELGLVAGAFCGQRGFRAGNVLIRESIARRSRRGIGVGGGGFFCGQRGFWAGNRGKHRTEVTEGTEEGTGVGGGGSFCGQRGFRARNRGEHRAEVTVGKEESRCERSLEKIAVGAGIFFGGYGGVAGRAAA